MHPSIVDTFLGALPGEALPGARADGHLATVLDALVMRGRAAWPQLALAPHAFAGYVATRMPAADVPSAMLAKLHAEDLFLAAACASNVPGALAAFDAAYAGDVAAVWRTFRDPAVMLEDAQQIMREKLFVGGPQGGPKILAYRGEGELRSWVRVIAVRTLINAGQRKRETPAEDDVFLQLVDASHTPDIAHLKEAYRDELRMALRDAIAQLADREKNLLRYSLVHGLNIDEIGRIYGVHRTSAFRWLAAAREELTREVHRALAKRLRVSSSEVDSIVRLAMSRFDTTLARYFGE